ncbi:hypothetical protein C8J57DRAFT_1728520 [Mycena rebaudengoi]|nr:hypothetical protein C8J57DRAFT_1728520 [Mycena rebaudengoi]
MACRIMLYARINASSRKQCGAPVDASFLFDAASGSVQSALSTLSQHTASAAQRCARARRRCTVAVFTIENQVQDKQPTPARRSGRKCAETRAESQQHYKPDPYGAREAPNEQAGTHAGERTNGMVEYLQSLPEEAVKELLQVASDGKLTSYFAVAALTFLIYDHLLSFDLEIRFIWMRPKSLACYLYIWNRYLTLAITCISTSVEIATMFFIINDTILKGSHYVHVGPLIKGCYSLTVPTIFVFYPVPSLIVTFSMFVMTLYNYRSRGGVSFTSCNTLSLADLFFRDGIYWFLAIVGSSSYSIP